MQIIDGPAGLINRTNGTVARGSLQRQNVCEYPRQITTGTQSPLSGLFSQGWEHPMHIGSWEITKVPMPHESGDIDELAFRPNFKAEGGTLDFKYDSEAFSDDEFTELAELTFLKLG